MNLSHYLHKLKSRKRRALLCADVGMKERIRNLYECQVSHNSQRSSIDSCGAVDIHALPHRYEQSEFPDLQGRCLLTRLEHAVFQQLLRYTF